MQSKFLLVTILALVIGVLSLGNSGGRAATGNGDNTGSPAASGAFCQSCHSAGAFNPSVTIEVFEEGTTTAITEYAPEVTYDVKITVSAGNGSPAGYGMQTSVLDANNLTAGSFSDPSNAAQISTLSGGREFLEQSQVNSSGVFEGKWTAPAAGTGGVTFYTGANAVNGDGSTAGDGSTKSTFALTEGTASSNQNRNALAAQVKIFPNPVQDVFNVEIVGATSGQHSVALFNAAGQQVLNEIINVQYGMDVHTFDVSNLAKGIYQLQVSQNGQVNVQMMVK